MKKLLAIIVSVLLIASTVTALPLTASAAEAAAQTYPQGMINVMDEFGAWGLNSDGDGKVIYDYQNMGITSNTHKGISYSVATNTLTLDNVPGKVNAFMLQIEKMGDLKINLVGESNFCYVEAADTNLTFTGSGTLNLGKPFTYTLYDEKYTNEYIFGGGRIGITDGKLKLERTVTINFDAPDANATSIEITNHKPTALADVFSTDASSTKALKWDYEEIDNSYDEFAWTSNARVHITFPAGKLLYLEGDENPNNYWILSNRTGTVRDSFIISRLIEKDGRWFEVDPRGENNKDDTYFRYPAYPGYKYFAYNDIIHPDGYFLDPDEATPSDVVFKEYEDFSGLPETLCKDGKIDAYVYEATDSSYQIYEKNGEQYVMPLEISSEIWVEDENGNYVKTYDNGTVNPRLNPSYPPLPTQVNYAYNIYKVTKYGDGNYDHILDFVLDPNIKEETFDSERYQAITKEANEYLETNGYKKVSIHHDMPMSYVYTMGFSKFSIIPGSAKSGDVSKSTVSGVKAKTYKGKALTQSPTVKLNGVNLIKGTDYTLSYKNNKKVGTATMTITGMGKYTGTKNVTFKINKAAQPMKATAVAKTVKISKLKSKKQTVKNAITIKNNKGAVSYAKVKSGSSDKLSISNKGVITVKKGSYKKTTLKIKVKVTAKGDSNYKSGSKTVTVSIKTK